MTFRTSEVEKKNPQKIKIFDFLDFFQRSLPLTSPILPLGFVTNFKMFGKKKKRRFSKFRHGHASSMKKTRFARNHYITTTQSLIGLKQLEPLFYKEQYNVSLYIKDSKDDFRSLRTILEFRGRFQSSKDDFRVKTFRSFS